jgi:hypothetical protein
MGTMWLSKETYHFGGESCRQIVLKFFGYKILFNLSPSGWSIRFGILGFGFSVTTKPLFSVRYGYNRIIKVGKYYIVKL